MMTSALRHYVVVTAAYWGFTLTDGALRMLVLLHFYTLGYRPFEIALLFLLYEFFGMVTNLVGGWVAVRLGLRVTLFVGLALQIVALFILSLFDPTWKVMWGVTYVMGAQALSGIAKDLTKMSAKSAVRTLAPTGNEGILFKWVALLTGSKNTLKGVGFFLGGLLLTGLGFAGALQAMAVALVLVLAASLRMLPGEIGRAANKVKFSQVFSKSRNINYLSAARFFLFGSRDVWFVVGLPLFLSSTFGWSHSQIGAYLAAWVIGYGIVQAATPKFFKKTTAVPCGKTSRVWILMLLLVTIGIAVALAVNLAPQVAVLGGLVVFGFVFAINSAVHSYLVLALSKAEHASMDIGFYYMANAGGRLVGTVLSGLAYQSEWLGGGLVACLTVSALFLIISWLLSLSLPSHDRDQIA